MKNIFCAAIILCLLANPCLAASGRAKKEVRRGNLLYNKGRFEDALKQYEKALVDSPDSDIVNFNLGAALYKTQDYGKAIGHFERSLVSQDESLEQMTSYNLGNANYKYGIANEDKALPMAVGLLKKALHHYEHALGLDPDDKDARYNYEFVKKELERLEEKLEQEQKEEQEEQEGQEEQQEQEQQDQKEKGEDKEAQQQESEEKEQQAAAQPQQQQEEEGREGEAASSAEAEAEEEKETPQQGQMQGDEETQGEMSEKEAFLILDSYRQEEEPRGLYKEKIRTRDLPEVLKDW